MVAIFGSLFNDIIIQRVNAAGNVTQIINVPISYAEKEKMLTRVLGDPKIDRKDAILLPRMSFFLDGMTYDNSRKITSNNKYIIQSGLQDASWQYAEVPWDFHFTLWVYVKNVEDATKIIEQIVPFFTPAYTVRAFLIPNRQSVDVPITLKEMAHGWTEDEKFVDREVLIWELHFTLKGYLYGPINNSPVIDLTVVNTYYGEEIEYQPINNKAFGVSDKITWEGV